MLMIKSTENRNVVIFIHLPVERHKSIYVGFEACTEVDLPARSKLLEREILVVEKHPLPAISALGNMVGQSGNNDTGNAGHGQTLRPAGNTVN
jgi:hypothetical protein